MSHGRWIASSLVLVAVSAGSGAQATSERGTKALARVDDLYRGKSSKGKMTMKVVNANYTRELELEIWTKGEEKSLIRVLAPLKEKGTATLRAKADIWNYLPKVKSVIKVPSSMLGGSWLGSHFTNDDITKQYRLSSDFDNDITFEGERDGNQVVEVTAKPKAKLAVVWGKVVVRSRAADLMPLQLDYYDEDMKLVRTMSFAQMQKIKNQMIPMVTRIAPTDKPNEYTEIRYSELDFDLALDDDLFSLRTLQR